MTAITRRNRRRLPAYLVRLVLELVIVFVGVYAAFALSEYEGRREAAARRDQLQRALVREISDIVSNTERVAALLPLRIAQFDSAVAAGARPPLEPWLEPVNVQAHMWEATLESGALELFDVAMVWELSRFYNALNQGFEQIDQLRSLSESVLMPNLSRDASEFYDAAGRLRPKYQWYPYGRARLSRLASRITALGDSLITALQPQDTASGS